MPEPSTDADEPATPLPKKKAAPKKAILAAQVGDHGYRVKRTTNFLDVRVGVMLSRADAERYIAEGVNFTVMRNS